MGLRNIPFRSIIKEGLELTFYGTKFLCCLHVTNTYLITPVSTIGPSMLPTIDLTPSLLLNERLSARFGKIDRGDIVLVRSPLDPRKCIVKRVVGTEGDSVTYVSSPKKSAKQGLEGDSLTNDSSSENSNDKCETVVVPKGHVWIQGDNIYNSRDSREFGPVPYGLIQSKVFWKVWPLEGFGPLWKK